MKNATTKIETANIDIIIPYVTPREMNGNDLFGYSLPEKARKHFDNTQLCVIQIEGKFGYGLISEKDGKKYIIDSQGNAFADSSFNHYQISKNLSRWDIYEVLN